MNEPFRNLTTSDWEQAVRNLCDGDSTTRSDLVTLETVMLVSDVIACDSNVHIIMKTQ